MTMTFLRLLTRNATPQLAASTQRLHTSKILFNSDSSDSDSDDGKRKKKIAQPKQPAAYDKSHRLNSLLEEMTKKSKVRSKVNIAVNAKKPIQKTPKVPVQGESVTEKLFAKKLTATTKQVATHLGGDVKKTESELLKKILTPSASSEEPMDFRKLVMGMSIDRSKTPNTDVSSNRADQVRVAMQKTNRYGSLHERSDYPSILREKKRPQKKSAAARVDIDSGSALNIFTTEESKGPIDPDTPTLSTWDFLERRELKLLVTHPPNNFLEQMIRWTEQGRLWRFPIDNEQDIYLGDDEHFSEHIFLEQHLEGWCPSKGPIRHFMELVCVGLSKNPYMLARDKKARIMWFKDYFEAKRDLLLELGAYGGVAGGSSKKQIEA